MKFISKESRLEKCCGRTFLTNKFLWFPVTIHGETRWLEKVKVRWKIIYVRGFLGNCHEWYAHSFID